MKRLLSFVSPVCIPKVFQWVRTAEWSRQKPEMESRDWDGGRGGVHERDRERKRTSPCAPPCLPSPEWWRAAGASLRFVPRIKRCHISLTGQQASLLRRPSLTSMRIITQCQRSLRTTRRVSRRRRRLQTHTRTKPQSAASGVIYTLVITK